MTIWNGNKDKGMSSENNYEYEHFEQGFIESLQEKKSLVIIHLLGGTRLIGRIKGSDDHTILISRHKSADQMIYKTAVTTINIFEDKQNV